MAAPLGFKDFTTGEVLTAADVDGYLMQGIWVFANATARDAAVTSPQEGNSCYLKDTDVIQVYSGSSWVVKSGGSSPLTTKGDLYTYSTTDTRIGVGANNTVLTADSSTATGLKWAAVASGGMTLLSTTTLSGTSTTISGISGDYTDLVAMIFGFEVNSTTPMRINPNSTASAAISIKGEPAATPQGSPHISSGASIQTSGASETAMYLEIKNYASTTSRKPFLFWGNVGSGEFQSFQSGVWNNASAITSLVITTNNGTSTYSSGTVLLYGVK
jgi:hypothetical protein